jgi:hypothetical protein
MPTPDRQNLRENPGGSEETGDFELTAAWDAEAIAALPMIPAQAEPEASMAGLAHDAAGAWPAGPWHSEEPAAASAPPARADQASLDSKLADIAARLEGTLQRQDPQPALAHFGRRLDSFEARVEAVVERANKTEDRESLRVIEAHVREIDAHFDTMRSQIARLSTIDARVGEIWNHVQLDLPPPGAGLAGLVESAVTRALAAASVLRSEAPDTGSSGVTAMHLARIEDAFNRLMERLDAIEATSLQFRAEDPNQDLQRLDAAYGEGLRALGGNGAPAWSPTERGHVLHAEDYAMPARRRIPTFSDVEPMPRVDAPMPEEIEPIAPPAPLQIEPEHPVEARDDVLEELRLSALRARERAQWEAARDQRAHFERLPGIADSAADDEPQDADPADTSMPLMLREDGLGSGRTPVAAPQTAQRSLAQGRWYRGFFLAGAMVALGGASFLLVDRVMGPAPDTIAASGPPTEAATRVAQPGTGVDGAETIALPPSKEIESPGAAARAASLPATIASASLRHAAANGEPAAEFEIAARYADGRGVAPDTAQAFIWYQRSAMHGYPPAQFRLGAYYERGLGTDKDIERAKLWYRRAAEKGHVKAMHNLAVLATGATPPDFAYAAQWFREAAERNLPDSQFNLAMLYETGRGVPQNQAEAYKWYALAVRNGDLEASRRMDFVRGRLSQNELAAVEKAVATWVPTPMSAMPGNDTSERAAP